MNNPKHKLVPLEPTEEMVSAGTDFMLNHIIDSVCTEQVYKRMLAAAPTQPPTAELLALPDKWRERNHKPEGGMISYRVNDCADELESILSRMQAPPQEGE